MMKKEVLSLHDRISLEAYLISERAGHPSGMDKTFWEQAEAIVHGRAAVVAGAGKAKARPKAKAARKPAPAKAVASAKAKAKPATKRVK